MTPFERGYMEVLEKLGAFKIPKLPKPKNPWSKVPKEKLKDVLKKNLPPQKGTPPWASDKKPEWARQDWSKPKAKGLESK